jgi:hypothetical protein
MHHTKSQGGTERGFYHIRVSMDEIRNYLMTPDDLSKKRNVSRTVSDPMIAPQTHATVSQVFQVDAPQTIQFRPLTPKRTRSAHPPPEEERIFKPFRVNANASPFDGAKGAIQAHVTERPFEYSFVSDFDEASDVVHVTKGLTRAPPPSPASLNSSIASTPMQISSRKLVPTPTHYPESQLRFDQRQAEVPLGRY